MVGLSICYKSTLTCLTTLAASLKLTIALESENDFGDHNGTFLQVSYSSPTHSLQNWSILGIFLSPLAKSEANGRDHLAVNLIS